MFFLKFILISSALKIGFCGAKFLSIGMSPRAMGLGEAYVAVASDLSSVFWNPAGVAAVSAKRGMYIGYTHWWAQTELPGFLYVQNVGTIGKIGVFASGVYSYGFKETKVEMDRVIYTRNEFEYTALQFGLTYSNYMTDKFALGFNIKGVYEGFGDLTNGMTFALDAGTMFNFYKSYSDTTRYAGWKSLRLGMSMQNLGADMKPEGTYTQWILEGAEIKEIEKEYKSYSLPLIFRMGLAMEVINNPMHKLTVSTEMTHPIDNDETIALGFEYSFKEILYGRIGYILNIGEIENHVHGLGAGIGIKWQRFQVDYSFSDQTYLPDIHRVGISLMF